MNDCLVCREVAGEVELPGGCLIDEEHVLAFHVPPSEQYPRPYLGHMLLVTRRHAPGFEDLTDAEAAGIGVATATLARALRAAGADHVFSSRIGTGVPHLHVHVVPRWPGTPDHVRWYEVDEWEGARRGGPAEVASFAAELAPSLATK
ncbi:MAG: HIT domain-containing protein [Gaiellaceae bacterium MAG52_C11]|nr:HIT domain-containing protein [Candidatus Gaiellasilicea maunaloa]